MSGHTGWQERDPCALCAETLDKSDVSKAFIDYLCWEEELEYDNNAIICRIKTPEAKQDKGRISSLRGRDGRSNNQRLTEATTHWTDAKS